MSVTYKESSRDLTVILPLGRLILPYCKVESKNHSRVRAIKDCLDNKIISINELVTDEENPVIEIRSYEREAFVIFGGCFEMDLNSTTLALVSEIVNTYVRAVEHSLRSKLTHSVTTSFNHIDLRTCPFAVRCVNGLISIHHNSVVIPTQLSAQHLAAILRQNTNLYCMFETTENGKTHKLAVPTHWCERLACMLDKCK